MKKIWMVWIAAALCVALAACTGISGEKPAIINTQQDYTVTPEDLAGPWHLDEEKNDLDAITAAWETFPGYAEWGAGMEIRSSGQMSWYIGAVGGSGTYAPEGDILHAELIDAMEQKEMSMDFRILGVNELQMTYGDTHLIWSYGDREKIPANNQ